jgi:hypothetical protein
MARPRAHVACVFVVPLAVLFLVAACSPAPEETPTGSGTANTSAGSGAPKASADSASIDPASSILTAVKLSDDDSLAALQGVRLTTAGTEAAARLLRSGVSGDTLWAATYVYASAGQDTALLRPIATSTTASPSIRAMAAAGLVGLGDIEGFDPLIEALGGSDAMEGSEPAGAIWEFASDVLQRYTHTGFGPTLAATDAERATIQAQWKTWLDANRANLRFDPSSQLWVTA